MHVLNKQYGEECWLADRDLSMTFSVWALGFCGVVTTSKQREMFYYEFPVPGKLYG